MKTFFKVAGVGAFLFGAHLYYHKETPAEFVQRVHHYFLVKKQAYGDLKTAQKAFSTAMAELKAQLPELQEAISDLQRDIDEARFQIQPRIDEINKYTDKMKKS